jgi:hypothetical protein
VAGPPAGTFHRQAAAVRKYVVSISAEDHLRIYRMVLMNMSKVQSFIPLTPEMERVWDDMEASINPNMGYDIPNEWPDPPDPARLHRTPEGEAACARRRERREETS